MDPIQLGFRAALIIEGCQTSLSRAVFGDRGNEVWVKGSCSVSLAVSIPGEEFFLNRLNESPAPESRSLAKSASRAADRAAVAEGRRSVSGVKRENEVFASLAVGARIDLSASRRLA
jgi:hypothetical protein